MKKNISILTLIIPVLLLPIVLPIANSSIAAEAHESPKVVYLTFDDGPSYNTNKILDILERYQVKATFFVIKREGHDHIYQRILNDSHTLGGHSSSHNYSKIYKDADAYYQDLQELSDYLNAIVGHRFNIIRFPGGSNNLVSNRYNYNVMEAITTQANYYGYEYYDWNVDAEDSNPIPRSSIDIANSVIEQCINIQNPVILMHDGQFAKTTPDSLPIIIEHLQSRGYVFKAITQDTPVIKF